MLHMGHHEREAGMLYILTNLESKHIFTMGRQRVDWLD